MTLPWIEDRRIKYCRADEIQVGTGDPRASHFPSWCTELLISDFVTFMLLHLQINRGHRGSELAFRLSMKDRASLYDTDAHQLRSTTPCPPSRETILILFVVVGPRPSFFVCKELTLREQWGVGESVRRCCLCLLVVVVERELIEVSSLPGSS